MNNQQSEKVGWHFDQTYIKLPKDFFVEQLPIEVSNPKLILLNEPLLKSLGLDKESLSLEAWTNIFSGNEIPEKAYPIAQAYAGHQFGHFTLLGDGRAVLLGEQISPDGKRFDIQFKGSGQTPYSRRGDGRAALGPMLREYIISEAMHALNIPTTRSLAVVATGDSVMREEALPGAILTRVAKSHIRVGTFQFASTLNDVNKLKILADYTIDRHFSECKEEANPYLAFLNRVTERQASLVSQWMHVGFIHGVMNTDNMSISGETIDYGPCAFMDRYHPETVFSSIDQKIGLFDEDASDINLINELLILMQKNKADYTLTFRHLSSDVILKDAIFKDESFKAWYKKWLYRIQKQKEGEATSKLMMLRHNPAVIPRNYLVEKALSLAVEDQDYRFLNDFIAALQKPYEDSKVFSEPPLEEDKSYQTFCGT